MKIDSNLREHFCEVLRQIEVFERARDFGCPECLTPGDDQLTRPVQHPIVSQFLKWVEGQYQSNSMNIIHNRL